MSDELREQELVDEIPVARYLGVSTGTLRVWRKYVPPREPRFFIVLGQARYLKEEVIAWAATHPSHRTPKGFTKYQHDGPRSPEPDIFERLANMHPSDECAESVSPASTPAEER